MSECHPTAEEQIALWRCLLLEHDEILREEVDELEAHVREAVAERVADGASEEQRVADAIAAVGTPWVVVLEHAKADPGRVWRRRIQRMLAGPLAGLLVLALITLLGTALFVALDTAEGHYETAGTAYALALRVGGLVALVLAWRVVRGRERRVVGWLDPWLVRLSRALPRSVRARRVLVGVAVAASIVWATPMALWGVSFAYQQGWALMHYRFATVSTVWYAVPLVAIAQWGHCGRAALRRLPAAHREIAAIWSRRVRWMLVGIVLHIIIRCVGESLADGAATLAWNALAPFEHLVAAHMVTNVVVIGCAALAWLSVAAPGRHPRLGALDSIVRWWRRASRLLTSVLAALLLVTAGALLVALDLGTDVLPAMRGYDGLDRAIAVSTAVAHGLLPVVTTTVLVMTARRSGTRAPSDARELNV